MSRLPSIKLMAVIFAFASLINVANAQTWNSDWGPVRVEADGNNFIARYNSPVSGIIVMRNQGGGNYSGYWARKCTSTKRYQIPAPVYTNEGSCNEKRETASGSSKEKRVGYADKRTARGTFFALPPTFPWVVVPHPSEVPRCRGYRLRQTRHTLLQAGDIKTNTY